MFNLLVAQAISSLRVKMIEYITEHTNMAFKLTPVCGSEQRAAIKLYM